MEEEPKGPSLSDLAEGLVSRPGGSVEGLFNALRVFSEGAERGVIRSQISCEEARREWFIMARSMYVANNPEPRFPIDAETGIHLGGCTSPACQKLHQAYWQVLRPSQPSDSSEIAQYLDILGKEIRDLQDQTK